jgi:ribonucleoside-diphosphate reductase alpha chain
MSDSTVEATAIGPREPIRERLPATRSSLTHKFEIGDLEGYLTVGLYPDGRPGELFLKIAKHGSTVSGLADAVAVLTSLAFQHGVPIESLVRKFEFTRFEPSGWTKHPEIHQASSLIDYVFRWLGWQFSEAYRSERAAKEEQLAMDTDCTLAQQDEPTTADA